jgi:hypothetical protein
MDQAAGSKAKAIPINVDGLYEKHKHRLRPQRHGDLQQLALGDGLRHPGLVLWSVLARMGWPAGGALPHHRTQVLHLWHGLLAAGCDLPGRTAGDFRLRAVPGDCRGRSSILRLCLSADGLYRNSDVDRAQDRGRTPGANEARRAADESARKFRLKFIKHSLWLLLPCGQESPSSAISRRSRNCSAKSPLSNWGPGRLSGYFSTPAFLYLMAGFLREQVCKYMCPYARFQGVMFDPDTLIISYDPERGEPRGGRKRRRSDSEAARRLRGLQHLCSGLPDRHRHPQRPAARMHCLCGLYRCLRPGDGQGGFAAWPDPLLDRECLGEALYGKRDVWPPAAARTLLYTSILLAIILAAAWSLAHRVPLKVDVLRDRSTLVARGRRRAHRERVQAAHLEYRRSSASLFDQRQRY